MAILKGLKIVEFEGLGPGPFCGMLLADLGADVILIERPNSASSGPAAVFNRGKRSIVLDLKDPAHIDIAKKLTRTAEGIIEGLRPGVMERLGLGPEVLCAENPKLVYGRLTGWGQDGPLAQTAGHDVNYISIAGANWYASQTGDVPVAPPTLVGDVAGGALYLAIGILSGVLQARQTGKGTVVDAAIVDGAAHMLSLLFSLKAAGGLPEARGGSMLDGAHFYDVYRCADGRHVSFGALEPKFYFLALEKLGLNDDPDFKVQYDQTKWPAAKQKLRDLFASQPASHWNRLLGGTDACFAQVLSPEEALENEHVKARSTLRNIAGVLQAAPAPRFDGEIPADPLPPPTAGQHTEEILAELGLREGSL
ncbi:MAG: CaiB/BaiF CoA-transferase family protein [Pseudomonadota bacterium]